MKLFSIYHILIIFISIFFPILITKKLKKNSKITIAILLFLLSLEIIKFFFLTLTNNYQLNNDLPLQLCYIYPIIGLIYIKTKKEYLLNYLGPFGILFALAAIIFTNPTILNFDTLYCYFYHFFLLISGIYITKNYKTSFNYKNILILLIQIIIAQSANTIIKNGSNYIFLNTFLDPINHTKYIDNIAVFNIKINNISINDILINLINILGYKLYTSLFIITIITFSSLWLYILSKKNYRKNL